MTNDWHSQAKCRGLGPAAFYPAPSDTDAIAAAKRVCRSCPVRERCLETILAVPPIDDMGGIWGGTCRDERLVLRRERRRLNGTVDVR